MSGDFVPAKNKNVPRTDHKLVEWGIKCSLGIPKESFLCHSGRECHRSPFVSRQIPAKERQEAENDLAIEWHA